MSVRLARVHTMERRRSSSPFLHSDTFAGTDGAAWDTSKWNNGEIRAGGAATLSGGRGKLNSGTSTGWAGKIAMLAKITARADSELLTTFRYDTTEAYLYLFQRGDAAGYGTAGYVLHLSVGSSSNIKMERVVSGSGTQIGSLQSFTITENTDYTVRWRCVGTSLQARAWATSGSEPGTWNLFNVTDSGITAAGAIGVAVGGGNAANGSAYVANWSIAAA